MFCNDQMKGEINKKSEVLQGRLDLMILKTLQAMGPLHGFGIARRLEQLSEEVLRLNEGTVYTSLLRLQQEGWIAAEWGASENNRKAKFYSITKRGLKQLARETEDWERISGVIDRLLRLAEPLLDLRQRHTQCEVITEARREGKEFAVITRLFELRALDF